MPIRAENKTRYPKDWKLRKVACDETVAVEELC